VRRLGELVKDILELAQYYNMKIGQKKNNNLSASTMTRRVGVYVPTKTSDGQGGYTTTYALQETIWGDFRPAKSTRTLLESELTFYQDAKVYLRYGLTIADFYQLEIEGKMYTIQSINDVDNQHRFLEIILNG
jgi:SPP1 family predicted phage head-tail adaptor